jgi:hypothetical protein
VRLPFWAAAAQSQAPLLDLGGKHGSEAIPPEPHSLVADIDAALGEQILNVAQ